jgi:hypothetical protein
MLMMAKEKKKKNPNSFPTELYVLFNIHFIFKLNNPAWHRPNRVWG